jgi:hypothetical protein
MNGTTTALAVVAVLVLIAFVVMRSRKRQASGWEAGPAALGMEAVGELDPALTAAIIALHRPPVANAALTQTWSLTRIYRYPEPGVNCYSVTIHLEQTGEVWQHGRTMRTESRETRVVAVVAPGTLQVPRLQLMSRAVPDPAAGALATLAVQAANAITDEAAEQAGGRVEFGDDPEFDRRYLVLSPHPAAARELLDSTRRSKLAGLEGVQVSLEGSLMLVGDPTAAIRHRDRPLVESLRAELEIARRVLSVLGESSSRVSATQ